MFVLPQATEANLNVDGIHASTMATLDILIDDVNDQKPLFYKCEGDTCTETNNFSGEVEEHASAGLSITGLNMRVKDKDAVRRNTSSVIQGQAGGCYLKLYNYNLS